MSHEYVQNTLLYMYSSCSGTREAIKVLDDLPSCDLLTFNSALSGYLEYGALQEGLDVLRRMAKEDLVWDVFSCMSSLKLCSSLRDSQLSRQIHSRMLRFGFDCHDDVRGALINMYGKCGNPFYAQRVYNGTKTQNIVLNTSIMDAYFQNKSYKEALNLFAKMETKEVPPNEFTFSLLLNSTAQSFLF